jgi:hypothetical protein
MSRQVRKAFESKAKTKGKRRSYAYRRHIEVGDGDRNVHGGIVLVERKSRN